MKKRTLLALACLALGACAPKKALLPTPAEFPTGALRRVPAEELPLFTDDLDEASLRRAIDQSLSYYAALPASSRVLFGRDAYSVSHIRRSLRRFRKLLEPSCSPEERRTALKRDFTVYKSTGAGAEGRVIFSAYYEHSLPAGLTKDRDHRFPIYAKPSDLVEIDMGQVKPEWRGKRVVARFDGELLRPYPTREEIDSRQALKGRGLEIAWARDPFDIYLLQVEGSGWLHVAGSTSPVRIRYAANNGHPYRSVGLALIERGLISRKEMSMKGLRSYLTTHPKKRQELLNTNPRYIFFRLDRSEAAPWAMGSLHVPLTPGRSIATDPALFPRGGIAWIKTQVPILDEKDNIKGYRPFARFVLNQDEGGAIKGPGRLDLFVGGNEEMIRFAGRFWREGEMYFLVLRK